MTGDFHSIFDFDDEDTFREMTEEEVKEFEENTHYLDQTQAIYHERYKKLSASEKIKRYIESHQDPKRWDKLAKYYVEPHQNFDSTVYNNFISLISNATDENVLQKYLAENPSILTTTIHPAHHGQICIPKPKLGNQLVPDFFIAGLDSGGYSWFGVELESPIVKMFTKDGEETKELKHAIRQIQEWRSWLKNNIPYARTTLGYMHIDPDLPCFVFMGKRENEILDEDKLIERRQEVKNSDRHGLFIYHYEWLLDKTPTIVRVDD